MPENTHPTPPLPGVIVQVIPVNGPVYRDRVIAIDEADGAVILEGGEVVANHLEGYSRFETIYPENPDA